MLKHIRQQYERTDPQVGLVLGYLLPGWAPGDSLQQCAG